jgi:hypothetical protein
MYKHPYFLVQTYYRHSFLSYGEYRHKQRYILQEQYDLCSISLLRKANNVPNSYLLGTVLYTIYSIPCYELCSSLLGMVHQVEYFSLLGIVRPVHCTAPSLLVLSDIYSILLCWKQYRRYSTAFCSIKNSMYGI